MTAALLLRRCGGLVAGARLLPSVHAHLLPARTLRLQGLQVAQGHLLSCEPAAESLQRGRSAAPPATVADGSWG